MHPMRRRVPQVLEGIGGQFAEVMNTSIPENGCWMFQLEGFSMRAIRPVAAQDVAHGVGRGGQVHRCHGKL